MKKIIILALTLMMMLFLVACSGGNSLNGTQSDGYTSYKFFENNVTRTRPRDPLSISYNGFPVFAEEYHGTFSIRSNQIEFVWTGSTVHCSDEGKTFTENVDWEGYQDIVAADFTRTENTITFGRSQYSRQ